MRRSILALFLCCVASNAWGALRIDGWVHYLQPDTITRIPILAYGDAGDMADGMDLYMQIAEGGDEPPIITAVDSESAGTLFGDAENSSFFYDTADPRIWLSNPTCNPRVPVRHDVVAWVTVDTTGTLAGESFALRLQGIMPEIFPPDGLVSDFALDPVTVHDGAINIVSRQTLHWYGADGSWDDAKWSGGSAPYPVAGIDAIIDTPYAVTAHFAVQCENLTVSGGATLNAPSITANSLTIGGSGYDPGFTMNERFVASVPEPSSVILAMTAVVATCGGAFRRFFR